MLGSQVERRGAGVAACATLPQQFPALVIIALMGAAGGCGEAGRTACGPLRLRWDALTAQIALSCHRRHRPGPAMATTRMSPGSRRTSLGRTSAGRGGLTPFLRTSVAHGHKIPDQGNYGTFSEILL
jgi:hypothetical protein